MIGTSRRKVTGSDPVGATNCQFGPWRPRAARGFRRRGLVSRSNEPLARFVTSDAVLTEYLNALADEGPRVRLAAVRSVESMFRNPTRWPLPAPCRARSSPPWRWGRP